MTEKKCNEKIRRVLAPILFIFGVFIVFVGAVGIFIPDLIMPTVPPALAVAGIGFVLMIEGFKYIEK